MQAVARPWCPGLVNGSAVRLALVSATLTVPRVRQHIPARTRTARRKCMRRARRGRRPGPGADHAAPAPGGQGGGGGWRPRSCKRQSEGASHREGADVRHRRGRRFVRLLWPVRIGSCMHEGLARLAQRCLWPQTLVTSNSLTSVSSGAISSPPQPHSNCSREGDST